MLIPLEHVWRRAENAKQESDTAYFFSLLYVGELIIKLAVSGFVACVSDDRSRSRYTQLHRLVRADGIGEWAQVLDEILVGPTSQLILSDVKAEQRQLTEKVGSTAWQYQALEHLNEAIRSTAGPEQPLPTRIDGRRWFSQFAMLRNKTRGHGATLGNACSNACMPLEQSLKLLTDNLGLFNRQWAFLHQNLSGKYRVAPISGNTTNFDHLRSTPSKRVLSDGVYLFVGELVKVDLVFSDADISDFAFPNGGFGDKYFETLSYASDNKKRVDATPYLTPATQLPESETDGLRALDVIGNVYSNLPARSAEYVRRSDLETELKGLLIDDRYPVITLVGRGGIGKTSLALEVLHDIAQLQRYEFILWFSARDVDLLAQGPKVVKPRVLNIKDIADTFTSLTNPPDVSARESRPEDYFADALTKGIDGASILFVFDNFETVKAPVELYKWLSTYIRLPNKLLITTRVREFKADYPVDVGGMTEPESEELVNGLAARLEIRDLISKEYRRELIDESDGHPYVLKILLGEIAKNRKRAPIPRVIAGKEEILDALFERTYLGLSAAAQRVFLTLCGWRSMVPELALEAVILGRSNEAVDVIGAIDELHSWSLIDLLTPSGEVERFISTPLVASTFGRRKLSVSPLKAAVDADLELLQQMGALQKTDLRHGVTTKISKLVRSLLTQVAQKPDRLPEFEPILEFIANRSASTWLELSGLYEELSRNDRAIYAARRFLESSELDERARASGWDRLALLCKRSGDQAGEIQALVERSALSLSTLSEVSHMANQVNSILRSFPIPDRDERLILVRQLAASFEQKAKKERADSIDMSRLAWLYLHMKNEDKAREVAKKGAELDPDDPHCAGLIRRLAT